MSKALIKEAKKLISGKSGRLEDQELEELAKSISNLGFKIGFARAYAAGPDMVIHLLKDLEEKNAKLEAIEAILRKQ